MGNPLRKKIIEWFEKEYQEEMARLLFKSQIRDHGEVTDDARELQTGHTWTTLLKPARDLLASHIARVNNPHAETANSLGSMPHAEAVRETDGKASQGFYPVSHYGFTDFVDNNWIKGIWKRTGWVIECTEHVITTMGGYTVVMPKVRYDLRQMFPQRHQNNTFVIGIRWRLGSIYYQVTEVKRASVNFPPPETYTYMHLGNVTTDDVQVSALDVSRVVRIGAYRISDMPVGSAFPRTPGAWDSGNTKLRPGWK